MREQPLRAPDRTALVIGNPLVSDQRFPSLPSAAAEAVAVAGVLEENGYTVQPLIERDAHPLAVYSAMHQRPWRVLHVAAHGVFEFIKEGADDPVSGVMLDDAVFSPADAEQMSHVPDLVFINCCFLGQTRGDAAPRSMPRLAANLATQFIRMGSRAVVAAGWAVDDAAATTFATTFYRSMLGGALFGDAIIQARKTTYAQHRETNTWGAYQCYGDASFSLAALESQSASPTFVAVRELIVWLDRFKGRAREAQGDERGLLQELQRAEAQVPPDWWNNGELNASAAAAFAELGELKCAIDYYTRAVNAEQARAPMWALEQLVSCKVRYAGELAAAGGDGAGSVPAMLDEAEMTLKHLLALGRSSERLSLLGALMKRRALLAGPDSELSRRALREMSAANAEAFERTRTPAQPLGTPYPLANQLAAEIILSWSSNDGQAIPALLEALQAASDAQAASHTDFFSLSAIAECALLKALRGPALDAAARQHVEERYVAALSRGITTRQLASVRMMLGFFRTLISAEHPDGKLDEVSKQLGTLEQALVSRA
jgi:tetratricopeptide (TPR) repeat protein